MDSVRHKITGEPFTFAQFESMTEAQRARYKGKLACEICGMAAYFKRKSVDGKKACFGAKHKEGCSNGNSSKGGDNDEYRKPVNKKEVDHNVFKLQFNKNFDLNGEDGEGTGNVSTSGGHSHRHFILEPTEKVQRTMTMGVILKYALKGTLKNQPFNLDINGTSMHVKDATCCFTDISKDMKGQAKLYWGFVKNVGKEVWLNTGSFEDKNALSIRLADEIKDLFWNNLKIVPKDWKPDTPVIVFGELKYSSKSEKPYIDIDDLKHIFVNRRSLKSRVKKYNKL